MSKTIVFIVFATVLTLIISGVHYYVWLRLFNGAQVTGILRIFGAVLLASLTLYIPISLILSRSLSSDSSRVVLWITYLWIGMIMLLFVALLSIDFLKIPIGFIAKSALQKDTNLDVGRRAFISQVVSYLATFFVFGAVGYGVKKYLSKAIVKRLDIHLSGLPEVFQGFRIVQISDLHIGQLMTKETLKQVVHQVNALQPDLIVITGDLADGTVEQLAGETIPLKDLRARHGVFFVTGNHDYFNGVEEWIEEVEHYGIKNLHNEHIRIEKGSEYFYLVGVTDREAARYGPQHAPDYAKAFDGLEVDKRKIVLAHQPIQVNDISPLGADLVLSGHTHGGQTFPFHLLVYLQQPYLKGHYTLGDTQLYVNQGTGCWGPPIRIGSENEITEITLRA